MGEVAIKVLPEQFTQDAERLARFEREAQLASLNHPNIAAIHSQSSGTKGGTREKPHNRRSRARIVDICRALQYDVFTGVQYM